MRAVFYWQALRSGYSVFEYTPISELIRKGYAKYPQAYVDTELDEGDLTYFITYKLDIIVRSLAVLADHLKEEEAKILRSQRMLRLSKDLNLRQRLLLEHALRHVNASYTVKSHSTANGIAINTSRTDLISLAKRGLLTRSTRGNEDVFTPAPKLFARFGEKKRS